jgi:2-iminobutanoate/2-iminopropanoate deaminase
MSKTAVTSPELTPPVGPFSQAIEVGGFLYFSGQVAQDPDTGKMVEGGRCGRDGARLPKPIGGTEGGQQES